MLEIVGHGERGAEESGLFAGERNVAGSHRAKALAGDVDLVSVTRGGVSRDLGYGGEFPLDPIGRQAQGGVRHRMQQRLAVSEVPVGRVG